MAAADERPATAPTLCHAHHVWRAIRRHEAAAASPLQFAPTYWQVLMEARGGHAPTIQGLYQEARE